jgi:hypothetical protein
MRLWKQLVLAICLIPLFGCAKNVSSNFDPLAIFPATATWVWDDSKNILPDDPTMVTLEIDRILREVVGEAFSARGYTEAPDGIQPDYLLHYEVGVGIVVDGRQRPPVATGSFELTEFLTGRQVWVGFLTTNVDVTLTEKERTRRLQRELRKMLKNFPPSQRR